MNQSFQEHLNNQLDQIRDNGLYKSERTITTPQDVRIRVDDADVLAGR